MSRKVFAALLGLALGIGASAQAPDDFFQIFDLDLKAKQGLKEWASKSDSAAYQADLEKEARAGLITGKQKVIDINTALQIKINKDRLKKEVGTQSNPELMAKIERLKQLILVQTGILRGLDQNDASTYYAYSLKFYRAVSKDPDLKEYVNELINEFFASNPDETDDVDRYVVAQMEREVNDLIRQLESSETYQQYRVQLVAYLVANGTPNQIHVENFDNIDQGEFYEVTRFVTSFSEEDQAQFASLAEAAQNASTLMQQKFNFSDVLKRLPSYQCASTTYTDLQTLITAQKTMIDNLPEEVKADWNTIRGNLTKIVDEFGAVADADIDPASFLSQANSLAKGFYNDVNALESSTSAAIAKLESKLTNSEQEIKDFMGEAKACLATVKTDLDQVKAFVNGVVGALSAPDYATAALNVSNKTLSFATDDIPETGNIYLKQSGRRENGDQLIIKLMVGKKDQNQSDYSVMGAPRVYELNLIGLYSETTVSLALGFPKTDQVIEHDTYFMPSGNLLFKIGSRKSRLYNNFFSIGLGPSLQAPDMNGDGAPEIAAGVILTTLKDYLGVGWSYNFSNNLQTGFWFITLSLPVNMPGLPISSVAGN